MPPQSFTKTRKGADNFSLEKMILEHVAGDFFRFPEEYD